MDLVSHYMDEYDLFEFKLINCLTELRSFIDELQESSLFSCQDENLNSNFFESVYTIVPSKKPVSSIAVLDLKNVKDVMDNVEIALNSLFGIVMTSSSSTSRPSIPSRQQPRLQKILKDLEDYRKDFEASQEIIRRKVGETADARLRGFNLFVLISITHHK